METSQELTQRNGWQTCGQTKHYYYKDIPFCSLVKENGKFCSDCRMLLEKRKIRRMNEIEEQLAGE